MAGTHSVPKRAIPVCLDDVPVEAHKIQVPQGHSLPLLVAELVERYEQAIARTLVAHCAQVRRDVLDSRRLSARHLPNCPAPSEHGRLPMNDVDCVALAVDYNVSPWAIASFILRVRARPGLITAEIYVAAADKAGSSVLRQFRGIAHAFRGAESRQRNPDNPREADEKAVKAAAEGILHVVQAALDEAATPLAVLSAGAKLSPNTPSQRPLIKNVAPPTPASNPASSPGAPKGAPGQPTIKRRI